MPIYHTGQTVRLRSEQTGTVEEAEIHKKGPMGDIEYYWIMLDNGQRIHVKGIDILQVTVPRPPRQLPVLAANITTKPPDDGQITVQQGGLVGTLDFSIIPATHEYVKWEPLLQGPDKVLMVTWVGAPQNADGMGARLLYYAADYAEKKGIHWILISSSIKNNFYYACGFQNGQSPVGDINLVANTLAVRRACAQIRVRKSLDPARRDRYQPGQYQQ